MGKTRYLVFREYTREERPSIEERSAFYGWTDSKEVIKVFLKQRDPSKYIVRKSKIIKEDGVPMEYLVGGGDTPLFDGDEEEVKINYLLLTSSVTGEKVKLFMAPREMNEAEQMIQTMLSEKASLSNIKADGDYVEMIINLRHKYAEALNLIGYRPPDISYMFPHGEYDSQVGHIIDEIESAYSFESYGFDPESDHSRPMGSLYMEDIYSKVVYSVESFIMVLRDDM